MGCRRRAFRRRGHCRLRRQYTRSVSRPRPVGLHRGYDHGLRLRRLPGHYHANPDDAARAHHDRRSRSLDIPRSHDRRAFSHDDRSPGLHTRYHSRLRVLR